MLDLEEQTLKIIDVFFDAGGYSDIPEKEMRISIYKYLNEEYKKQMALAMLRLSKVPEGGDKNYEVEYRKEYARVEDKVMDKAEAIAAYKKSHLE